MPAAAGGAVRHDGGDRADAIGGGAGRCRAARRGRQPQRAVGAHLERERKAGEHVVDPAQHIAVGRLPGRTDHQRIAQGRAQLEGGPPDHWRQPACRARPFTRDQLLTNLTIYWATSTITSSVRHYCEYRRHGAPLPAGNPIHVPAGFAIFANDFIPAGRPPRELAERFFTVNRWTELPRGGHFAALEEPALLAAGIRAFFRPLRDRHGRGSPAGA